MELLFLWIEDFRNIKKQGFNFSSELNFIINEGKNHSKEQNYTLTIEPNKDFVDLFDKNILNVTGIIGKNGAGKSNLLHCLKLLNGQLPTLICSLIFSILDPKKKEIRTYYYKSGGDQDMVSLNVTVNSGSKVNEKIIFQAAPYTLDKFSFDGEKVKGLDFDFKDIACCYFSNTFDSHRENVYEKINNVSTNYRVEAFLKKYLKDNERDRNKRKGQIPTLEAWPSHIQKYHKSELNVLLKFISYCKSRKTGTLPELPDTLIIQFNLEDYQHIVTSNSYLYSKEVIEKIQQRAINILQKSKSKRDDFLNMLVLSMFYYSLRNDLFKQNIIAVDDLSKKIYDLTSEINDQFFDKIRNILNLLKDKDEESKEVRIINDFFDDSFIKSIAKIEFDSDAFSENKVHYRLKINNNLWTLLDRIYDLRSLDESNFIDYSWGGNLSTGQEAFLSHFARLHDVKKQVGNKPVWLLIDEGDLYFHPQWQKEYFNHLILFVEFIFPRNKVQIILTTHSPFIASDLPKQNLIFLKKGAAGNCEVANNDMKKETFGNNIHELYSDSFFLNGALIGDFAKQRIDDLIKLLNKKGKVKNPDAVRSLINIVGEPIIRTKLLEMLVERLGESGESARLRAQRDYIDIRLKEIKDNDTNQNNNR